MSRLVFEHSGLNYLESEALSIDIFKRLAIDGYIYKLQQTDGGREYLEKCYILQQTKPDRKHLRELNEILNKGGSDGDN
ncbi:MAG: hypothetical protein RR458_04000 [Clostridia bacterium]